MLGGITDHTSSQISAETIKESIPEMPKDVDMNAEDILTKNTVQDLAKVLKEASPAMKEKIVAAAIKNSIMDAARVALIKQHCGIDVLQALTLQRSVE